MHWTDQFASSGRVDAVVAARTDPVSGQPALKMAEVFAEPVEVALYGFFVSRRRPALETSYWAIAPAAGGWRGEIALDAVPADFDVLLTRMFGAAGFETLNDVRSGRRGFALLADGRLLAALWLSSEPVLVARQWAADLLAADGLSAAAVLAGRPSLDRPDGGAIVCACRSVGINTIAAAVTRHGCTTVEAVGAFTTAGTSCGSCRAEIGEIIHAHALAPPNDARILFEQVVKIPGGHRPWHPDGTRVADGR